MKNPSRESVSFSFRASLWFRQWLCLCDVSWDLSYNWTFLSFLPWSVMILLAFIFLSCFLVVFLLRCFVCVFKLIHWAFFPEQDSKNAGVSFFVFLCRRAPIRRPYSQTFLAETVETGDKNRDDFHCMQMSFVMSMRLIFGDDWNDACKLMTFLAVWKWCNFPRLENPWFLCNYARVLKSKYFDAEIL